MAGNRGRTGTPPYSGVLMSRPLSWNEPNQFFPTICSVPIKFASRARLKFRVQAFRSASVRSPVPVLTYRRLWMCLARLIGVAFPTLRRPATKQVAPTKVTWGAPKRCSLTQLRESLSFVLALSTLGGLIWTTSKLSSNKRPMR
jgi:hypothetical protein